METTQMAFRAVKQGDKYLIGVFVASENRWFECEVTATELANIAIGFDMALRYSSAE